MQWLGPTDPMLEKRHRGVVGCCVVASGLLRQWLRRLGQELLEERELLFQLLGIEDESFVRLAGVQHGGVGGVRRGGSG